MSTMSGMELFRAVLFMQLFFAVSVSLFTYALPSDVISNAYILTDLDTPVNINETSVDIQNSLTQQTNVPIIDVGALVFYSGNIIIDLILNFLFAIPQMITLILSGLQMLLNLNSALMLILKIFAGLVTSIFYMLSHKHF